MDIVLQVIGFCAIAYVLFKFFPSILSAVFKLSVIAIALILRGVFDVGKIGFKNFSSKLPILKCEIYDTDGSKKIQYHLIGGD